MPSSPWPPAAGAPPPQQRAAQGTVSTVAPERLPVERAKDPGACRENQKISGFIRNEFLVAFHALYKKTRRYVFEEIVIESKTVRLSRWPFTRLFADPARFCREKSSTEKGISRPLAGEAMPDD
ncbi:hypothetical protein ZEAMMB73_Zm00001d031271 [Zea mays]|uniref:Uncharacterized protein n=1 Tax=Zea mays TaxID=4577 RepID=A0A1D6KHY8_MAIZE|nr:hypothetical protein ZEAMMB73_Zm00001d031271 [Zea mays]